MAHGIAFPDRVDPRVDMDVVGAVEGADKSSAISFATDFLKHYEQVFADFRAEPINLIEVGIRSGASLRTWKWFFPNAQIVGLDINPNFRAYAEDRVTVRIGSQADATFLAAVCADTPPTIFIDDGSHLAEHNIFTFEHVFPRLLPGGIYVVEDLFFHLRADAARWQTANTRNAPEYFLDLARSKLALRSVAGAESVPAGLAAQIDSIAFINGAAIIRRAYTARDLTRALALGRDHAARHAAPAAAHLHLAAYILRHGGPPAEAAAACRTAIAAGGSGLRALTLLATALLRQEEVSAAIRVLGEAAALVASHPAQEPGHLTEFAVAQTRAGLAEEGKATLRSVLARWPGNARARALLGRQEETRGARTQ